MTANTAPIFTLTPNVNVGGASVAITSAAADYTGISTNYKSCFTAGANGGYIQRLRCKAIGTNVAAVMRVFINNGSSQTTSTNNAFYGEILLPATTASTTVPTVEIDYAINIALPAGYVIYVGLGAAVASGWTVVGIGGSY